MYPDGKSIQYEGQFKDDRPFGKFNYYSPEGKINATIVHLSAEKSKAVFYHDNGAVMSEGIFINKLKDSLWYTYTKQNELSTIEPYKKNKLDGVKLVFYLEGQQDGKPKILRKESYKDSSLNGIYEAFYTNGKLKQKGAYDMGAPSGSWEDYSLKGTVIKRFAYKNGVLHGWVYQFDDQGKVVNKRFFKNGVLLKEKELETYLTSCKEKGLDPEE
jgi:antitoxin component YwqK of YwqJK toxin-antitoxin module